MRHAARVSLLILVIASLLTVGCLTIAVQSGPGEQDVRSTVPSKKPLLHVDVGKDQGGEE